MNTWPFLPIARQPIRKNLSVLDALIQRMLPARSLGRASFRPKVEQLEERLLFATNVTNYHYDYQSTGADLTETQLTPANVNPTSFGKLFSTPVDGQLFAQPLVLTNVTMTGTKAGTYGSVAFVATEHDSLYAINAGTGAILWQRTFLDTTNVNDFLVGATSVTSVASADINTGDIGTEIGVTGTPVIDLSTNTLYLDVKTKETVGGTAHYVQRLHAINIADGSDRAAAFLIGDTINGNTNNTPIYVKGAGDGSINGVVQFNALRQANRPALSLVNGTVYIEWASHGDNRPYHGWIAAWNVSNLQTSGMVLTGVVNVDPNGGGAGIWGGGGGLTFEPDGSAFYVETGNGFGRGSNPTLDANGFPTDHDYFESLLKVVADPVTTATNQNANGWGLKIADYFTPFNVLALDIADEDFGSGSPLVLPDSAGIPNHPHLMVAAGKEGKIYLIDRDNMGKFNPSGDNVLNAVANGLGQTTPPVLINGSLSTPAYFQGEIYWVSGYSNNAKAFIIGSGGTLQAVSQTANGNFGYVPGSVIVTANGNHNGIVWIMDRANNDVHAYNALSLNTELWNSNDKAGDALDSVVKFAAPTVANGELFVGTNTSLTVYGLIAPPAQTQAPKVPANLSAQALSGSAVELNWTDSTLSPNFATRYVIQASTDGVHFATVATAGQEATTYTVTGLNSSTTYTFQIAGSNTTGTSVFSPVAMATTTSQTGPTPTAPVGLGATPAGPAEVYLTWINTASNQTGFTLTRATDSNFTQNVVTQTIGPAPYYYTDTAAGMSPGNTYYYRLQASNASGLSSSSNLASVAIPLVPPQPTNAVAVRAGSQVTVSWIDHAGPYALGYQIMRAIDGGAYALYASLPETSDSPPSTQTYTDTNIIVGHIYSYQIQARNVAGFSAAAVASVSVLGVATLSLDAAGNLGYLAGLGVPDRVSVQLVGGIYTVTDPAVIIAVSGAAAANVTGAGSSALSVPAANVSAITLDTRDGNDTINIVSDAVPLTITADSGGGAPALSLGAATGAAAITANITNNTNSPLSIAGSGTTTITGNLINSAVGGLTITGSGTVSISGDVNLGKGNLVDASSGSTTISGAITGTSLGNTAGLLGNYYSNIPNSNGGQPLTPNGASWLGNQTPTVSALLTTPISFPNIDTNGFSSYAPGVKGTNLGALWTGNVTIPGAGTAATPITFLTGSDDGSRLWLDGNLIVNNNIDQGVTYRAGQISLVPGSTHTIMIGFYQGGGGAGMFANWDLTGATPASYVSGTAAGVPIPASAFSAPANTVTQSGSGTLMLAGIDTYVGQTFINKGTLVAASSQALGTTAGGTTIAPGGTLAFGAAGNFVSAEPITMGGPGSAGNGAIASLGGNNTLSGPVTLSSDSTVGADSGTLSLNANIQQNSANLTFTGAGNTIVNGVISSAAVSAGLLETQINGAFNTTAAVGNIAAYGSDFVTSPLMGEKNGKDHALVPVAQHTWATNDTWIYQGQMFWPNYNNTGIGYLSFAKDIDDSTLLRIDGKNYINDGGWQNTLGTGVIALPTGFHSIDIRFANGGGGAGADAQNKNGWTGFTATEGFVYRVDNGPNDPLGDATTNGNVANYVIPTDPGDGSLFRVLPPSVFQNGTGITTFNATNTYTGPTIINAGILVMGNVGALGSSAAGTTVNSGGTLGLQGNIIFPSAEALTLSGNGAGAAGALDNISGSNIVNQPLSLTGDMTIGSDAGLLTLNGNIGSGVNANFTMTGAGNILINGQILGGVTGKPGIVNFTKVVSGTVTLTNTNTYSGSTTATGGILQISGDNSIGGNPNSSVTIGAATLEVLPGASYTSTHSYVVTDPASTIQLDGPPPTVPPGPPPPQVVTIPGSVSGTGTLNKTGPGTLVLGGSNVYTGGTTDQAGAINVTNASGLGSGTITMAGGLLSLNVANLAKQAQLGSATGWTQDVIWSNSEASPAAGTTSGLDNTAPAGYRLYEAGSLFSPNNTGLPHNGVITSVTSGLSYQLQPYTANNDLRLAAVGSSGTLTLAPASAMSPNVFKSLSFLDLAANGGDATYSATVNFADGGASTVFTGLVAPDMAGASPPAITNLSRVKGDGTAVYDTPSHGQMFDQGITLSAADSKRVVKSITFAETASTTTNPAELNVFAVSGLATFTALNLGNNVVVTADSTIDVETNPATLGGLLLNRHKLTVTGNAPLTFTTTTLQVTPAANISTVSPAAGETVTLGAVGGSGFLNITGPGITNVGLIGRGVRLGGSGTIGQLVIIGAGGEVNPGSAFDQVGTLTTSGGISFGNGSMDNVDLAGNAIGAYDQISSGGTITLGDAFLNVNAVNGFRPTIGQSFTIIKNTGGNPIVGSFLGLPEGSGVSVNGAPLQISYVGGSGHDVVLTPKVSGPAVLLSASAAQSSTNSGTPIQVLVSALDANTLPAANFTDKVHFTSTDPAANLPADNILMNSVDTFNVTFHTAGNQTVTVSDLTNGAVLGSTTSAVSVAPIVAPTLNFLVQAPAISSPGGTVQVTVTARDAYNNATGASYTGTVHISSSDSEAILPADAILINGVGTFSVTFAACATGAQTISANDVASPGIRGATAIDVIGPLQPESASILLVTAPATVATNTGFDVTVTAKGDACHPTPVFPDTVTLTSNDPLARVLGSHTFTVADNSVWVFHNVTLKSNGNVTITALDTISTNPIITGSTTVNAVGLTPLIAATPSGFTMTFNQPINPKDVTIYGNGSAVADVTLAGAKAGISYPGTLVFNAADTVATFNVTRNFLVASSPTGTAALPDDTYTVTLASGVGSNGFQDVNGLGMDNGSGGHADFTGTFTTTYQSAPMLAIADFARGPNAAADTTTLVKVPNKTGVGIPVTLYKAANLTSAGFTLAYNSQILTVTGGIKDPSNPASTFTMTSNVPSADGIHSVATFAFTSTTPQSGRQILGDITAYVPNSAKTQYQIKDLLSLGGVTVNGGATVLAGTGVDINAYLGDVNGDHHIDAVDKALIANAASTSSSGFPAFTLMDPAFIADLANDNSVTSNSVSLINNYLLGKTVGEIPALAGIADNQFVSPFSADPIVSLPAAVASSGTGMVSVPVLLDHPRPDGSTGLVEAELALTYDPKVLSLSAADITLGTIPAQGTGWQLTSVVDVATGQIGIKLYSLTAITSAQAGSLVNITFHVLPGTVVPVTAVQLVDTVTPRGQSFGTMLADAQAAMILSPGISRSEVLTGMAPVDADHIAVLDKIFAGLANDKDPFGDMWNLHRNRRV